MLRLTFVIGSDKGSDDAVVASERVEASKTLTELEGELKH